MSYRTDSVLPAVQHFHQCLLGMQTIRRPSQTMLLALRYRRVTSSSRCWQAMHEKGVGTGAGHHSLVDLEGLKYFRRSLLVFPSHACPDVMTTISVFRRFFGLWKTFTLYGTCQHPGVGQASLRATDVRLKSNRIAH